MMMHVLLQKPMKSTKKGTKIKENTGKLLQATNLSIQSDISTSGRQIALIVYVLLRNHEQIQRKKEKERKGAQRTTIIQTQK